MRGRPLRKLTPAQIASIQYRRSKGEKMEVLLAEFSLSKGLYWYYTRGNGKRLGRSRHYGCICDPARRLDQIAINPYCRAPHPGKESA